MIYAKLFIFVEMVLSSSLLITCVPEKVSTNSLNVLVLTYAFAKGVKSGKSSRTRTVTTGKIISVDMMH